MDIWKSSNKPWVLFAVFVLGAAFSADVLAYKIIVEDKKGNPIPNVVVAIPKGKVAEVNPSPAIMNQIDTKFVPHILAVEQGRQVIFPNNDDISHHVYSFSKPKRFEIKLYKGKPDKPIAFDQAGVVSVGCNIHDSMLGYVFVSPWPNYTLTDENGTAEFTTATSKIAVWHPKLKDARKPKLIKVNLDSSSKTYRLKLSLAKKKKKKRHRRSKKLY